MRRFLSFWWLCAREAFWGNASFANNWAWALGAPIAGAIAAHYGLANVTGNPITDSLLAALGAFLFTWMAAFSLRFVCAPADLYHEQKERADRLEGLRQIAADASRPPSFDVGFECTPFNPERESRLWSLSTHQALRIWVENVEGRAIEDCRVMIENFGPESPVKNGVMLLADNREHKEESARFDLAATEKRFFKFIDLHVYPGQEPDTRYERYGHTVPGRPPEYVFKLRSDQEGRGLAALLSEAKLDSGKQYFATIAVHGKNANSRRIDLTIDLMANGDLHVSEADSTASFRKEVSHENQN